MVLGILVVVGHGQAYHCQAAFPNHWFPPVQSSRLLDSESSHPAAPARGPFYPVIKHVWKAYGNGGVEWLDYQRVSLARKTCPSVFLRHPFLWLQPNLHFFVDFDDLSISLICHDMITYHCISAFTIFPIISWCISGILT